MGNLATRRRGAPGLAEENQARPSGILKQRRSAGRLAVVPDHRKEDTLHVPSSHHRPCVGANMTPMIDVVFLLIIFFLVSSHLARQENRLPLELPVAATYDPTDPLRAPLTVSVDGSGNWLLGGNIVDLQTLKSAFADHRAKMGREASIRIRSEGTIQYRFVQPVLRQAALAGVTDASIAVRQSEPGARPQ